MEPIVSLWSTPPTPIQFVFAGKAHPEDHLGKELIQGIAQPERDPRFAGRVVFVEDYDMNVGRHLVQGVDVWLNNPRRPQEASGTCGEKVVLNGGLNFSILDGWWAEAYDGQRLRHRQRPRTTRPRGPGRARRARRSSGPARAGDPALLRPRRDGLPRDWIARKKRAIRSAGLAVQRRPDGDGLRDQRLHPGRGRDEQRIARVVRAKSSSPLRGTEPFAGRGRRTVARGYLAGDRLE